MPKAQNFVKSRDTKTPVVNSEVELKKILARYGCSEFAVRHNYDAHTATVSFIIPDDLLPGAQEVPVRFDMDIKKVANALFPLRPSQVHSKWGLVQAERVAWRQLILWVDAALSAASAGMQKVSEAFLAHTLVRGQDGTVRRMVDHLEVSAGPGGWQRLLPSTTQPQ